MRCQRVALFFGGVYRLSAWECGDVDGMMLKSLDEDPMCSVSLLQRRAEPLRKSRSTEAESSAAEASEDASLGIRQLSDAIGKLVSLEMEPAKTLKDKEDGPVSDVSSSTKAQVAQEASHAMEVMQGAFAKMFSPHHNVEEAADGRVPQEEHAMRKPHNSHHQQVALAQIGTLEVIPPPLVFSWEGSPLTSDFLDVAALDSEDGANVVSNSNQSSGSVQEGHVRITHVAVPDTANETGQVNNTGALMTRTNFSANEAEDMNKSNVSSTALVLDRALMNDTVYVEASGLANNSENNLVSQTTNSAVSGLNSTSSAAENNRSTVVSHETAKSVLANQTSEIVANNTAIPVFVLNETELKADVSAVTKKEVPQKSEGTFKNNADMNTDLEMPKSSLYRVSSNIPVDMDKIEQDMDHILNTWVQDATFSGSTAGLVQVNRKLEDLSAVVGQRSTETEISQVVSDMSDKLVNLQSSLAQMDSADLAL